MANAVLTPSVERRSPLDRSLVPTWLRLSVLAEHWELIAFSLIFLIGFTLRIWDVGARALHHDESLHAYYSWLFYVGKGYSYDPLMHGPFQFEAVSLFYLLFGDNETSARLLAVVLGSGMLVVPYFMRRFLTTPGALVASAGLAISPVMVYFSRFIRDDIYLACFSLICFVCIVHYLERPRPSLLYTAAAAMALGIASMEAAYMTLFIFGSFLMFEALREWLGDRNGPVLSAVRATSLDTWLTALSIFVVLIVLLYSTFFTNPYGIWDPSHPLTGADSINRKDILGGLTYWKAQHSVQRGGQPWFYYLLTLPLYEQVALFFGAAGIVYASIRRSLVSSFLVWWALLSFGLYSWAGEKMPWLTLHIALPLILLAGLFMGNVLQSRRSWAIVVAGGLFTLCMLVQIHSTFVLNFVDGANPTEMMIYVQTSQDVPTVVHEIDQLSAKKFGGTQMPVGVDSTDVGGWPFTWYLRDFPNVTQSTTFNTPVCGGQFCPVLVMLGPEFDANSSYLLKHYVAQKYRWNWWFPEDYKVWFPEHWNTFVNEIEGKPTGGASALPTAGELQSVWNWLLYRTPFGLRGERWMYFLVRRDLVPGSKYFATTAPGTSVTSPASTGPSLHSNLAASFGTGGALSAHLNGPRAVTTAPGGHLYVADTLNHRVVEYTANGGFIRAWGQPGTGHGQFSQRDSPQGLALGPDGLLYVADTWNQRIEVFTQSGKFVRQWGGGPIGSGNGQFYGPRSVAVGPNGEVYVADTGNERIQVFSHTGKFLFAFGSKGTAPGQFDEPSAVAIAPSGTVYVADYWNQRVQTFTPMGNSIVSWPVIDWQPQSYDEPYLAISPTNGDVFLADPAQQRVQEYTSKGALVGSITSPRFTLPIGIAVRSNGQLAVVDPTANQVSLLTVARHAVTKAQESSPGKAPNMGPTPHSKPKKP